MQYNPKDIIESIRVLDARKKLAVTQQIQARRLLLQAEFLLESQKSLAIRSGGIPGKNAEERAAQLFALIATETEDVNIRRIDVIAASAEVESLDAEIKLAYAQLDIANYETQNPSL